MTTTTTTTIPFNKLAASDDINARALAKDGLDDLAASIETRGLIQPLAVRPSAQGEKYEVIDGRRRLAAIALLVKRKTWAKATPIPVLIRNEDDAEALETSLVANTVRLPMHPVDQHAVFARLEAQGRSVADIAARFGVSERTVKQQLALGRLVEPVRKAWRAGTITAEIAQAFAGASPDAQAAAWDKLKGRARNDGRYGGGLDAYDVKRELAPQRQPVTSIHPAVLERYTAAGGKIEEDLFSDAAYLEDAPLARRLAAEWVAEHAAGIRDRIKGQGWAWVALASELPPQWYVWRHIDVPAGEMSAAHAAACDALEAELQAADQDDEATADRVALEIALIEQASEAEDFTAEQRARSGCVLLMHADGRLNQIRCGILRPAADGQTDIEDALATGSGTGEQSEQETCPDCGGVDPDDCDTCGGDGVVPVEGDLPPVGAMVGGDDAADDGDGFEISGALMETITTAQTQAAAVALARDPALALRVLVAALRSTPWSSPAKVHITPFTAGQRTARTMPDAEFEDELARLAGEDVPALLDRLAVHVAASLTLLASHHRSPRETANAFVAALPGAPYLGAARETFLADDYFKRATKAVALAAIEEMREAGAAGSLAPEDVLAAMKKADLAAAAAEAASACGWLPPELRHPDYALLTPDAAPQRLTGKVAAAEQTGEAA